MTANTITPNLSSDASKQRIAAGRRVKLLTHMRRYPSFWIGLAILFVFLVLIVAAPVVATHDPLAQDLAQRLKPPSAAHIFGTDELGRDIYSRTIYGAQVSLPMSLVVVAISLIGGSLLGAVAGFFGGAVDDAIMRVADVTLAFPAIVLALAISALLGPSLANAAVASCFVIWPEYARLMRSQVLVIRAQDHVIAARSIGASEIGILLRHVLPMCWTPLIIKAALDVGSVILLLSALSFLGLGVRPPTAEWGAMIAIGRTKFYDWWMSAFPGFAILFIILGCNLIGEGLHNWLDPKV
ncbi:MAG: ABC transporter permease [Anaerolineae bacterium]